MAAKPVVLVVVATASIQRRKTSMFFSQAASPYQGIVRISLTSEV